MSLFQVIEIDDQWGVFAVNRNNPNDKRLANVCETQEYADELAADLTRRAAIEPTGTLRVPESKEVRPDLLLPQPTGRKFR